MLCVYTRMAKSFPKNSKITSGLLHKKIQSQKQWEILLRRKVRQLHCLMTCLVLSVKSTDLKFSLSLVKSIGLPASLIFFSELTLIIPNWQCLPKMRCREWENSFRLTWWRDRVAVALECHYDFRFCIWPTAQLLEHLTFLAFWYFRNSVSIISSFPLYHIIYHVFGESYHFGHTVSIFRYHHHKYISSRPPLNSGYPA